VPGAQEGQRQLWRPGDQRADGIRGVGAAQLVDRVVGPFRGAVAEVLLHRVVAQARLVAVQEVVVLAHARTVCGAQAAAGPLLSLNPSAYCAVGVCARP
jgi:hypothetical protein